MDPLRRLTRMVARQLGDGPGPQRRARQRIAVARLTRRPARATGRWRWAVPIAAAALLLWAWVAVDHSPREPTPIARVQQQPLMAGAWLAAASHEPLAVVFADHSRLALAPGSAVRVARVDPAAVHLELERGQVTIESTPARAWSVTAGPHAVEMTGATADIAWDPQSHALAVDVRRGDAVVRGDAQPVTRLGPGQRLALAGQVATPAPCVGDACATERPRTRPRSPPTASWSALAQAGEHAATRTEAERQGFAALLGRLDAASLDRLAHSARLAGDGPRARAALLALRRRFPHSSRAGTAGFLLGRIAVDLERDPAAAITWFGLYLAEHPDGPLAEEARGRLLRALADAGDRSRARAAADEYLQHHPRGSHATLAQKILDR